MICRKIEEICSFLSIFSGNPCSLWNLRQKSPAEGWSDPKKLDNIEIIYPIAIGINWTGNPHRRIGWSNARRYIPAFRTRKKRSSPRSSLQARWRSSEDWRRQQTQEEKEAGAIRNGGRDVSLHRENDVGDGWWISQKDIQGLEISKAVFKSNT